MSLIEIYYKNGGGANFTAHLSRAETSRKRFLENETVLCYFNYLTKLLFWQQFLATEFQDSKRYYYFPEVQSPDHFHYVEWKNK